MAHNPIRMIQEFDQSIWQDDLRRQMVLSGELQRLIDEDGIRGVTSNPAIFKKSIDGSPEYDDDIRDLVLQGKSSEEIYQSLTVKDVQLAADLFRPLYNASHSDHGYVSLEVNPHLARDIRGTIEEARKLWQALDRPNVMIKVPATEEGLTCIEQLLGEGINVNVTLLFGLPRYREVAMAYIRGLETCAANGKPLQDIASVASFFLSRIDVAINPRLKKIKEEQLPGAKTAEQIYGQVAIASAKCAFRIYQEIFSGERFKTLLEQGARPQRLLWASTSTKEEEFSDIKYVEALIGPNTVSTLPGETLDAYRDHGKPEALLTTGIKEAEDVLNNLEELDILMEKVTQNLIDQGLEKFNKPYDSLMEKLQERRKSILHEEGKATT